MIEGRELARKRVRWCMEVMVLLVVESVVAECCCRGKSGGGTLRGRSTGTGVSSKPSLL